MSEFNIGDRVIRIEEPNKYGKGVIIDYFNGLFGVKFDSPFADGHSFRGKCEDGCGYWCSPLVIEHLDEKLDTDSLELDKSLLEDIL